MRAILVAAEREQFTPCGSCMDWIFEIGDDTCLVITEKVIGEPAAEYLARELMPHYPF